MLQVSVQVIACDRSWTTHIPTAMEPVPYTALAINMHCSKAVFDEVKKVFVDYEKQEFGKESEALCLELYETKYNHLECDWEMEEDQNSWDMAVLLLLQVFFGIKGEGQAATCV